MKILITGDSWGKGEWGWDANGNYCNTHPGLQAYLEHDGHAVTNVSRGMGSNLDAYRACQKALEKDEFDVIIWFETDPLRDLKPENYHAIRYQFKTYRELLDESSKLRDRSYKDFGSLGQPIRCIGGSSKIDASMMSSYENLLPLISSITELLLDGYEHPELWASDWIFLIDRQFDIASINEFLKQKQKQDKLATYKNLFWPDGQHPNRHAWQLVYDHIKPILNL